MNKEGDEFVFFIALKQHELRRVDKLESPNDQYFSDLG